MYKWIFWENANVRPSECVKCNVFPCADIIKNCYLIPNVEIIPDKIMVLMVSEAPPVEPHDYFYAKGIEFNPTKNESIFH